MAEIIKDEGAYFPLPIDKLIYVVGKQVNFDIFLRKDRSGNPGPEYFLFFAKGEVFEPWPLIKTKYSGTRMVYYHQRDRSQVIEYLSHSTDTGRPAAMCSSEASDGLHSLLETEWKVAQVATDWCVQDEYIRFKLTSVFADWEVPFDVYLKTRVPGQEEPTFLLVCPKGEVFATQLVKKIQGKSIENIYAHQTQLNQVLQYLYHNLTHILADDELDTCQKISRVYDVTLMWTRQFFEEGEKNLTSHIKMGLEFVHILFDHLRQDPDYQHWVLEILRHEGKLYTHSLNCCLLGLAFTNYLGWPHRKICDFAMGALVHDIGMTTVPTAVLRKPGRLSKEEMGLVRNHPAAGVSLLSRSSLTRDCLLTVLQHHEHCNGTGYPDGLVQPLIDPLARVMRIIDSFEALTSRRPWREPFPPLKALWIMRQEWQQSGIFDADLLSAFIKFLAHNESNVSSQSVKSG